MSSWYVIELKFMHCTSSPYVEDLYPRLILGTSKMEEYCNKVALGMYSKFIEQGSHV